jgi:hypothetical protein
LVEESDGGSTSVLRPGGRATMSELVRTVDGSRKMKYSATARSVVDAGSGCFDISI